MKYPKEMKLERSLKEKVISFWRGWGYSIFIAFWVATSFKSAIADWNVVPTGSMKPTIVEGDRIFVNKLAYDLKLPYTTMHLVQWSDPRRGDIVVFFSPEKHTRMVKRVVGLPGDTIAMVDNVVFINGKALTYSSSDMNNCDGMTLPEYCYLEDLTGKKHTVMITQQYSPITSFKPIIVPQNSYFMMGDNRNNSADSRYFGFVERSAIIGKATTVIASLDINDNYKPRWKRFFSALL